MVHGRGRNEGVRGFKKCFCPNYQRLLPTSPYSPIHEVWIGPHLWRRSKSREQTEIFRANRPLSKYWEVWEKSGQKCTNVMVLFDLGEPKIFKIGRLSALSEHFRLPRMLIWLEKASDKMLSPQICLLVTCLELAIKIVSKFWSSRNAHTSHLVR